MFSSALQIERTFLGAYLGIQIFRWRRMEQIKKNKKLASDKIQEHQHWGYFSLFTTHTQFIQESVHQYSYGSKIMKEAGINLLQI
jgi:hypothetical protein